MSAANIFTEKNSDWTRFNVGAFEVRHSLAGHPLFTMDALKKLVPAAIARGDQKKFAVAIDNNDGAADGLSIDQRLGYAADRVEDGGIRFKLTNIEELNADYGKIFNQMVAELEELTFQSLSGNIIISGMTAFISSSNQVTPYHFDHDSNFLFQIRGTKEVRLFDQTMPAVLTPQEVERFYWGKPFAGVMRDGAMEHSQAFTLTPGIGVHHPPLAPHLVSTGDDVSVSISMWFSSTEQDRIARIHQANFLMRKLGVSPEVGRSAIGDEIKYKLFRSMVKRDADGFVEIIFSGIDRIKAPLRVARHLSHALLVFLSLPW